MFILTGILCLIFLCSSILLLSIYPISQDQKMHPLRKTSKKNETDYYNRLFSVYEDLYEMSTVEQVKGARNTFLS